MLRPILRRSWFLLALLLTAVPASARTWLVEADGSGEVPTVGAALEAAVDGDTIELGPGKYAEGGLAVIHDVVIRGRMGAEVTAFVGNDLYQYAIAFGSGRSRATVLEGVTVRDYVDNGIRIWGASEPVIRNNLFIDNGSPGGTFRYSRGGGIQVGSPPGAALEAAASSGGGPLIEGNTFLRNTGGFGAGGIDVWDPAIATIRDNLFEENEALIGGAVHVRTDLDGTVIEGNRFERNRATRGGGAIRLHSGSGHTEILYNLFVGNTAGLAGTDGQSGGGILVEDGDARIRNNTLVENLGDPLGGGIAVAGQSTVRIDRNIFAENLGGAGVWCGAEATVEVFDNLSFRDQPVSWLGSCTFWWPSDDNESTDPMFCSPETGDYRVAAESRAFSHPFAPLGAFVEPGCSLVPVEPITWGGLKARFSGESGSAN